MSQKILPWFDQDDERKYACVMWNITRHCNYNCSYCTFHEKGKFPRAENVEKISAFISEQYNRFVPKEWYKQIIIFGGEPTTIGTDLLLKTIHKLQTEIENSALILYSNLSADLSEYIKFLTAGPNVTLVSTYHGFGTDPNEANVYLDKISYLEEQLGPLAHNNIITTIMQGDPGFHYVKASLEERYFKYNVIKPHRGGEAHAAPDKEQHVINTEGWKELVEHDKNQLRDWKCVAGLHNNYIEYNGDVFPCHELGQAWYRQKDNKQSPIGNILNDTDLRLFGSSGLETCRMKHCRFELFLTKYKGESHE